MEECDELSQRCSKALRFGLKEIQPGQKLTNGQRIDDEFKDLVVAMWEASSTGKFKMVDLTNKEAKSRIARINKYLAYSKKLGILKE